ncbi:Autophagy- protein 9A [Cichlidogyrus casuarinus]|uniref:Autophagy-related protein 9 n=1 Tax=Cichlidogyrus casuarinus TaxID=1844966 RepID=A0ABD2PM68_9PLAT
MPIKIYLYFKVIPEEGLVYSPEVELTETLRFIQYMPDSWKDAPNSYQTRIEFAKLFQYRAVGVLEDLLSPFITPFVLMFALPKQSLTVIDFLRNYTVDMTGVGDICSYASLDVKRHGNKDWKPSTQGLEHSDDDTSDHLSEEVGGKTELSVCHFHLANPDCKLPDQSKEYLVAIDRQMKSEHMPGPRHKNKQKDSKNADSDGESEGALSPTPGLFTSFMASNTDSYYPKINSKSRTAVGAPVETSSEWAKRTKSRLANAYNRSQMGSSTLFTSGIYQPFMPSNDESIMLHGSNSVPMDMSLSGLYMNDLNQRHRLQRSMRQSQIAPGEGVTSAVRPTIMSVPANYSLSGVGGRHISKSHDDHIKEEDEDEIMAHASTPPSMFEHSLFLISLSRWSRDSHGIWTYTNNEEKTTQRDNWRFIRRITRSTISYRFTRHTLLNCELRLF